MSKKLIEVALPLEAINRESGREKSIRQGHPSTLHLWWARRPLAACRAVLFASLVDDPSAHPEQFPTEEAQDAERHRLFKIIERLVTWESTTDESVLELARTEIARSAGDTPPLVLDPFCGGGAIPLEAQRLGLDVCASDLNPVPVLITKAMIELPPLFADRPPVNPESHRLGEYWVRGQGLAEDIRYYGEWVRQQANARIGDLYPTVQVSDGQQERPNVWFWARAVICPNPACRTQAPLVRSFVLSTKKGREAWIVPTVTADQPQVQYTIARGSGAPPEATIGRTGGRCLACGTPLPFDYIADEARSGRMIFDLMAVGVPASRGRLYLPPTPEQAEAASAAAPGEDPLGTDLPSRALGFRVQRYGIVRHSQLFTGRQLVALSTFSDLVGEARSRVLEDCEDERYANAIATYLACAVSRVADLSSTLTAWLPALEAIRNTFPRGALSMAWDFVECNPVHDKWSGAVNWVQSAVATLPARGTARVIQRDAARVESDAAVVATDPPYYDNIGYADLSDFFYGWLRRSLKGVYPELFSTLLTPKGPELIADPARFNGSRKQAEAFFESGLRQAFARMRKAQSPDYPLTLFYAFKQAETDRNGGEPGQETVASTGWETMLEGLLSEGFMITGTWPVRTERGVRVRGIGSNALASSVVLVCRPRDENAPLATRREFIAALKAELPASLRALQHGNIAPVDLAQASIGPGMAVFSRYAKVVEADGSAMSVRTALGMINQALDELLAEQEGDFDAETRWAVAWFEQYGMNEGPFGVAETLSKAKNTAVNGLVEAGLLAVRAGKVRLLDRDEMPKSWDPATDTRLTVWEVVQHLVRTLDEEGEMGAAALVRRVGSGMAETARELAYRLYVVAERKRWAQEALAYNTLVTVWPELVRLAAAQPAETQQTMEM